MSWSNLAKLSLLTAVLMTAPVLAHAQTLVFGDQTWTTTPASAGSVSSSYTRNDFSLLDEVDTSLLGGQLTKSAHLLDEQTLDQLNTISSGIDRPAQNAELAIQDDRAQKFNPGQTGQGLDLYELLNQLQANPATVALPVVTAEPAVKLADTNQLGINELVAVGVSDFKGSPKNRLVNIEVGADKYNGLIIQPGQEFSFNQYLGDVDGAHGFLPELVIKASGVVPEFGGGLCQVSTTAFRAAMNAGLPITARRNHSFAVSYYSPQGTDATIYPGSSDLKFVNNLNSALLIRTYIDGTKLYFEYYGTKDDRQVSFEGPTVYDRKSDGSLKATWIRHVTLDNQTTTQTFNSTYLPPALFEHDATEQASTPNPQATTSPAPAPTPPLTQ